MELEEGEADSVKQGAENYPDFLDWLGWRGEAGQGIVEVQPVALLVEETGH